MPAFNVSRQPNRGPGWFDCPLARQLVQAEQRDIIPLLTSHVGVRGLYLRPSVRLPAALSGNMLQAVICAHRDQQRFTGDLCFADAELPVGTDALNLIYAAHVLETSTAPEALLAEFERCLMPEGVLFLISLSPLSPWRLHWHGATRHSFGLHRLRMMVQAAGFHAERVQAVGPIWPSRRASAEATEQASSRSVVVDRLRCGHLILARKRRPGMTAVGSQRAALRLAAQARPG